MKKFLALLASDIKETITIKDELINFRFDPVYENGLQFKNNVLAEGYVRDDIGMATLGALLTNYTLQHTKNFKTKIQKIEFRESNVKELFFRKAS